MARLAVKADELVKWFGDGDTRTYAVQGASFEAAFGEIHIPGDATLADNLFHPPQSPP